MFDKQRTLEKSGVGGRGANERKPPSLLKLRTSKITEAFKKGWKLIEFSSHKS